MRVETNHGVVTVQVITDQYDTGTYSSRYKMDAAILDDPTYLEAADLRSRIQDMWSIKSKFQLLFGFC